MEIIFIGNFTFIANMLLEKRKFISRKSEAQSQRRLERIVDLIDDGITSLGSGVLFKAR